jgi:hypothetical protein
VSTARRVVGVGERWGNGACKQLELHI